MYSPFEDSERPPTSSTTSTSNTYNNPYGPPPGMSHTPYASVGQHPVAGGNFPYRPQPPYGQVPLPNPNYAGPTPTGVPKEPGLDQLISRLDSGLHRNAGPVYSQPTLPANTNATGNKYGFKKRKGRTAPLVLNEDEMHKRKRAKRFEATNRMPAPPAHSPVPLSHEGPIVGTCQVIEKEYFRMQETDPSKIRPIAILRMALPLLQERYQNQTMEYMKICNQMKAIRQDLRVQQIRNEFAVQVYETHALMALENDDYEEFNQCQTQLATLYELNPNQKREMEFTAYRILFQFSSRSHHGHTKLVHALQHLTPAQQNSSAVQHAVKMCQALYSGNSFEVLSLFRSAPNQGRLVLKRHVEQTRTHVLQTLTKSVRSEISLDNLQHLLVFETAEACRTFLGPSLLSPHVKISDPSSVMIKLVGS